MDSILPSSLLQQRMSIDDFTNHNVLISSVEARELNKDLQQKIKRYESSNYLLKLTQFNLPHNLFYDKRTQAYYIKTSRPEKIKNNGHQNIGIYLRTYKLAEVTLSPNDIYLVQTKVNEVIKFTKEHENLNVSISAINQYLIYSSKLFGISYESLSYKMPGRRKAQVMSRYHQCVNHDLLLRLTFSQGYYYAFQLLLNVAILHQLGLIHCDLKPDNIMLTDGVLRVTDFGLVRQIGQKDPEGVGISGTPGYMAPDYLYDINDPRIDNFGVGPLVDFFCCSNLDKLIRQNEIYREFFRYYVAKKRFIYPEYYSSEPIPFSVIEKARRERFFDDPQISVRSEEKYQEITAKIFSICEDLYKIQSDGSFSKGSQMLKLYPAKTVSEVIDCFYDAGKGCFVESERDKHIYLYRQYEYIRGIIKSEQSWPPIAKISSHPYSQFEWVKLCITKYHSLFATQQCIGHETKIDRDELSHDILHIQTLVSAASSREILETCQKTINLMSLWASSTHDLGLINDFTALETDLLAILNKKLAQIPALETVNN